MADIINYTAVRIGPHTYQAECPTAHEEYVCEQPREMSVGARPMVWLLCPCCDALLHTGEDCDPSQPQYHPYLIGEGALHAHA